LDHSGVLAHAALVLARTALKVRAGERVIIVEDAESQTVGGAIADAADTMGAWVKRVRLERLGARPHRLAPEPLVELLGGANASVFVARALHQEAAMRHALLHLVRERGLRHAHMPGISDVGFAAAVRIDFNALRRVGETMLALLAPARTIVAESDAGTSLRISLGGGSHWFAQLGALEPGEWGSFPAGALYASPADINGVFVADASFGEFFGVREGLLARKAARLLIERGRVVAVEAPNAPDLRRDLEAMLGFAANSDRVGLVAIGVNYGIERSTGDASVDQNLPGLHLGIGDPAGRASGATWRAQTCFAACASSTRVIVDGVEVIRGASLVGPTSPHASSPPRRRDSGTRSL
jgi:aminopeptidase